MMGELRIDHLWKNFPVASSWRTPGTEHPVLQDVTFRVADGEFVSVVGRSGCGKSTLLNIAAGLEPASGGAVYVNDAQIRGPGLDRSVVFQDFALFPWLSVRDTSPSACDRCACRKKNVAPAPTTMSNWSD
jgi:ABC-type nitrate/sulfonate/bicarbonate transport system ATPase subunit